MIRNRTIGEKWKVLRVQIICNKKLRGETGEQGRKRVSCTDLSLRRIWIAFVFTTTQGCVVCQRLALIMGFVSVCLRKWHARVLWCMRVLRCAPCESMGVEKCMYVQVTIFARGWNYMYMHSNISVYQIHCFLCRSVQLNKCGMGSRAGTSVYARFLSVKVVKWNRISQNNTAAMGFGLPSAK